MRAEHRTAARRLLPPLVLLAHPAQSRAQGCPAGLVPLLAAHAGGPSCCGAPARRAAASPQRRSHAAAPAARRPRRRPTSGAERRCCTAWLAATAAWRSSGLAAKKGSLLPLLLAYTARGAGCRNVVHLTRLLTWRLAAPHRGSQMADCAVLTPSQTPSHALPTNIPQLHITCTTAHTAAAQPHRFSGCRPQPGHDAPAPSPGHDASSTAPSVRPAHHSLG